MLELGRSLPLPAQETTIDSILKEQAASRPNAIAIAAPGRSPLSYNALWRHVTRITEELRARGIGSTDRVVLLLPNGPELAVASLAAASCATAVPFNPTCTAEELAAYLPRLRARVLLVPSGFAPAPRIVAQAHGLAVVDVVQSTEEPAGVFALRGPAFGQLAASGPVQPRDIAAVFLTSGTSAWPRIAPLTHTNLCTHASWSATCRGLSPVDRCLNFIPLFRFAGFASVLLASLMAGASVICGPTFDPERFFAWLAELQPTWCNAVPTIHQAILAQAARHPDALAQHSLRFIKSAGAPLLPQLRLGLESNFHVPVVDGYGSTEAGHIAAPRLPGAPVKPGAVGTVMPGMVATMDPAGNILPPSRLGEIVVRGPTVFGGYEDDPEANAAAFTNGWFRTGDAGYVDAEGYLFLTGRLKEQINRGGEKISPVEIEKVLLSHPSVADAVAFPMPDAALGEAVAAAVVLRQGYVTTEAELRAYIAERLAPFKAPRRIALVKTLPINATGKVQRRDLAETLGLLTLEPRPKESQRNDLEGKLADIWTDLLGNIPIDPDDDFFQLGANSFLVARLVARIEATFGVRVPMSSLFEAPTVEALARLIREAQGGVVWRPLVRIQVGCQRPPLFCLHAIGGDVEHFYALAHELGPVQPIYGLRAHGLDGVQTSLRRVEDMAQAYVEEIRTVQGQGPYFLVGYSSGGTMAFEVAQQLHDRGHEVAALAILDRPAPRLDQAASITPQDVFNLSRGVCWWMPYWLRETIAVTNPDRASELRRRFAWSAKRLADLARSGDRRSRCGPDAVRQVIGPSLLQRLGWSEQEQQFRETLRSLSLPDHRHRLVRAHLEALAKYRARPYAGHVVVFRSREPALSYAISGADMGWRRLAQGGVTVKIVPGTHGRMLQQPYVKALARQLAPYLPMT